MRDKRVVIRDYIHNDLDCKTIPEVIAMLQSWLDYGKEFRDITIEWDGDLMWLEGTRNETDSEEQARLKQESDQRDRELLTLARLKAKYEPKVSDDILNNPYGSVAQRMAGLTLSDFHPPELRDT